MRRIFATVFVLALAFMPVLAAPPISGLGDPLLPYAGNGGYDVQHYTLDIEVTSVEDGDIQATTTIELLATADMATFHLDFTRLDINSIEVDGDEAAFDYDDGELMITPDEPLEAGEEYTVAIEYEGNPERAPNPAIGFGGWTTYRDGIYVAGQPFSATTFIPVNDHPRDKATYTIRVTVAEPYLAISNGLLMDEIDNGDTRTFVWEMNDPMASYLITIAIGEFEVEKQVGVDGLPITNYYPLDAPDYYYEAFARQPQIIDYLSELFGPYPFDSAGGIVIDNPRMGFALETQSIPIYGSIMMEFGGEQVVVHELAHQWFGDSLSLYQWRDIWLNEGFASYAEALWVEHVASERQFRRYLRAFYDTARRSQVLPGNPMINQIFDGAIYHRGALTLHALRVTVGDEVFFEILRTYTERFRYGNVTTRDFIAVCEEVSGQELSALFQTWLFGELPPFSSLGV
jgi:aminopeptidase N